MQLQIANTYRLCLDISYVHLRVGFWIRIQEIIIGTFSMFTIAQDLDYGVFFLYYFYFLIPSKRRTRRACVVNNLYSSYRV